MALNEKESFKKKNDITIINTNARSLTPKIDSLLDCFNELQADIAVVTETWLKSGPGLERDLDDLEKGADVLPSPKTVTLTPPPGFVMAGLLSCIRRG